MSTVDVRIVEMRFDNKDFESNVQTSMNTLDKLKEKLNLGGSSGVLSGLEKATKSLDLSGISTGVDTISDRFSNLGIAGMEVVKRLTNAAIDFGKGAVSSITEPIIQGGLRRAQNIEQAHFMLQGLLGDEEKVQEVMNQASESVNETAYSYDSAAKAAAQFTASGIEAGPKLEEALKGITGVAAMTGSQYEEISRIFTTTAGNGRVMGDTLLQLGNRGLNAAADMARFMNGVNDGTIETTENVKKMVNELTLGAEVTESTVREMVSDKDTIVSFELFSSTMSALYGAHAKKANETVTGVAANIKAALARIGADFYSPLIVQNGPLVQSLEKVRLKINEIRQQTGLIAKVVTPLIETAITTFGNIVEKIDVSGISNIAVVISTLWSNVNKPLNTNNLLTALKNFGESFGNIWHNIKTVLSSIGSAFKAVFPFEYFTGGLRNFSEGLKQLTENLKLSDSNAKSLQNAFKGIFSVIKTLVSLFSKIVGVLAQGLAPIMGVIGNAFLSLAGFIGNIVFKILDFIDKTELLQSIFSLIRNVITAVIEAFRAFGDGIRSVISSIKGSEAFKQLADQLDKIWTSIKNFTSGVFNKVVSGIKDLSSWIFKGAISLPGFIKEFGLFGTIIGGVREAIGWLSTNFSGLGDSIRNTFDAIKNSEGVKRLTEQFNGLWESVKTFASSVSGTLVSKIRELFNIDFSNFEFKPIERFAEIIDKAAGKVSDFITEIQNGKNPLKDFIDGFKNFKLDFSFTGVKNFFRNFSDNVKSFVNFESIGQAIQNVATKIKDAISKIDLEDVFEKFKDIVSKIVKGIANLIEKINFVEAFSTIGNAIKNGFKRVFEKIDVDSIIQPFKDFFGRIGDALNKVNWSKVFDISKQLVEFYLLFDLIRSVSKTLKSASGALDSLGGFLDTLSDRFTINKKDTKGDTILKIAGSITLIAGAMYIIAQIDEGRLNKSIAVIGGIFGAISLLLLFGKKIAGKDAEFAAMGTAFGGIGVGMLAIAAAAKVLGAMDRDDLTQAAVVIGSLITVFLLASKNAGNLNKAGTAFLGMAVAIDLLIPAMLAFGKMKWETIGKGGTVILGLAVALGGAARLATGGGGGTILALAVAIDLLIPALVILGKMKWDTIKEGAIKLGIIMGELALAVKLAQSNGKSAGAILAMVVAIVAATGSLVVLSLMDWKSLLVATASLGSVLLALGAAVKLSEKIKLGQVILMGVVLGEAVAALLVLTKFTNANELISAAESLALVLLAVTVSLGVLDRTTFKFGDIASNAAMMGVALGEAVAALWVLDRFTNGDRILEKATALSEVLIAVSGAMLILSGIKSFNLGAALEAAVGLDGVIVVVGGLFVGIGELADWLETKGFDLQGKLERGIEILKVFITGITEILGEAVSALVEGLTDRLPEIGKNLSDFMDNLKPFSDSAKSLDGQKIESSVGSITSVLKSLTEASLLDSIATAIGGGESSLTKFAKDLQEFGPAFSDYAADMESVNADVVTKSSAAAKSIAAFAKEIPNQGGKLALWIGDNTLAQFAEGLEAFGPAFSSYAKDMESVDPGIVTASSAAAQTIADFASKIPNEGGAIAWIIGDNTLGQFGEELASFGPAFSDYASAIQGVDDAVEAKTTLVAGVVSCLSALNIPNQGGFISWVVGDNTLAQFGEGLAKFGPYFYNYSRAIQSVNDNVQSKSELIAGVVERFSSVDIPNQGGFISWVVGDNTLAQFGQSLADFAPKFKDYSDKIKGINDNVATKSNNIINTIERYSAVNIKNQGGFISWVVGDNTLADFGESLAEFAEKFVDYANKVSGVNDNIATKSGSICDVVERFASVNIAGSGGAYGLLGTFGEEIKKFGASFKAYYDDIKGIAVGIAQNAVDSLYALIDVTKAMTGINTSNIDSFGTSISTLGGKLKSWINDVAGVQYASVLAVCNSVRQILTLFNEMASTNYSGAANFSAALSSIANAGISGFTSALTGSGSQITSAVASMMSTAVSSIAGYYNALYSAGYSAGQGAAAGVAAALANVAPTVSAAASTVGTQAGAGLAAGVSSARTQAQIEQAAASATENVPSAARRTLEVQSPSKVMMRIGEYAALGLAIGIKNESGSVEDAAEDSTRSVINTMKDALSYASNLLDESGELTPTITPVLDLTQIQNGASLIGSLLSGQSVSLSGTNSSLFDSNRTSQQIVAENSNKNVVDEITKLRTDVGVLSDYVSKLRIVLDSGALVGGLIDPIDTQLGRRQILAGRGV